ncbi:MAG: hemerythrin domain-containing protein [Burkholderiaceae bacterium]|nr:hemerythrin domain-containing protein [Burkholderiaceae bacterium]
MNLFAGPAAGFDEPFELLQACHERMHRSLGLLQRLGVHLARQGADAQAADAAADLLRYFDIAAPLHHQDEERHVFPRLLHSGDTAARVLAGRLQAEHRAMETAWARVRIDLADVREGRLPAAGTLDEARQRWAAFIALQSSHLDAEETQAYPRAREGLDARQQQAMGHDMAQRRGVAPALTPNASTRHRPAGSAP